MLLHEFVTKSKSYNFHIKVVKYYMYMFIRHLIAAMSHYDEQLSIDEL